MPSPKLSLCISEVRETCKLSAQVEAFESANLLPILAAREVLNVTAFDVLRVDLELLRQLFALQLVLLRSEDEADLLIPL